MDDATKEQYESGVRAYLRERISRTQLLKAGAAALAVAAVPGAANAQGTPGLSFPFFPETTGRYQSESILSMATIALTAEHLAVTFLTAALNSSALGLSGLARDVVQAALVEEQLHVDFLSTLGIQPLTDTFSVPDPKILTDQATFFATVETAESIFVAAYMTAVREFAELGQPLLAKYAYQIGAVEAEHRTLARAALALAGDTSSIPPNNKAFETDLFLYVKDAAVLLGNLGFLGTGPVKATYPGRAAALAAAGAMASAVIQTTPNNATTSVTATDNLNGAR